MSESARTARVGLLVLAATVITCFLILRLSSDVGLFSDKIRYRTRLATTQGLTQGAEVRFMGVTVGSVDAVGFAEDPRVHDIVVDFRVREGLAPRIDEHVIVELRSNGPLGDRLLELRRDPELPPGTPLEEGAVLPAKAPLDVSAVVDEGAHLMGDIGSIAESLRVITARLVAGEGLFGRLLKDEEFGDRTVTDLEVSIGSLRRIVEDSADGKNMIGMLVADEELAVEIRTNLRSSLRNLESLTARLERGEGPMGQLFREDSELSAAIGDFVVAARTFRELTEKFNEAEGSLAYRLLLDERYGDALSSEVEATLAHLRSVAQKIDEGDGSVGQFLNDERVYEGINDIVTGIERSWFINYVLKRKQKKGYKARVDQILRESDDPERELLELMEEVLAVEEPSRGDAGTEPLAAGSGQ